MFDILTMKSSAFFTSVHNFVYCSFRCPSYERSSSLLLWVWVTWRTGETFVSEIESFLKGYSSDSTSRELQPYKAVETMVCLFGKCQYLNRILAIFSLWLHLKMFPDEVSWLKREHQRNRFIIIKYTMSPQWIPLILFSGQFHWEANTILVHTKYKGIKIVQLQRYCDSNVVQTTTMENQYMET